MTVFFRFREQAMGSFLKPAVPGPVRTGRVSFYLLFAFTCRQSRVSCTWGTRKEYLGSDPSVSLTLCSAWLVRILWQWVRIHRYLASETGPP